MANFTTVVTGIYLEGLAVDSAQKTVWYSDVIAGGVHGLGPDGRVVDLNPERMWTGGVMLNDDGSILSSGAGGIMWNNPGTGKSGWLIREINLEEINGVNEMTPDGEGGIIFGTIDIKSVEKGETPSASSIFRLTVGGEVIKLADDVGFSNGLMYDKKRRRLYCNDTFHCTWVYDVSEEFRLSNKKMLVEKDDADGMALDVQGNIWITGFRSGHVVRFSPEGKELDAYQTPAGAITQVRFGGDDMCDIYINSVPVEGGDNLKEGEIPTERNSIMYLGRSDIPGMPIEKSRFELK